MTPYALRINDRYFNEDKATFLEIDEGFIKDTVDSIASSKISLSVFDSTFDEVTRIIKEECCTSFVVSAHFAKAKRMLLWFKYFEELGADFQKAIKQRVMYENIDDEESSIFGKIFHKKRAANRFSSVFTKEEENLSQLVITIKNKTNKINKTVATSSTKLLEDLSKVKSP